jgi:3-hydroxybutyryl-CoA dehydrogenase
MFRRISVGGMDMDPIQRVGIIGCGLMGSGIAEVCARTGLDVIVREPDETLLEKGRARIQRSMERAQKSGKLSAQDAESAFGLMTFTTQLGDFASCDLVVEAIVENEAAKVAVFKEVDAIVSHEGAILTSNTSSIPIMKLAVQTSRPAQVCGLHFFNPVPILDLVELVPSLMTSEETSRRIESFASEVLGKFVIRSRDRAGFIVNSLLIPFILSAIRMAESGFATAEHIDAGMVKGCNHPMGPLALADLIGLDTTMAVAQSLYEEFKEPLYAPPPLLSRMVEAGLLGRKTGHGFYDYAKR